MLATQGVSQQPEILVVDDEPEVRQYLDIVLRKHGYAVKFAEDGEQALSCLDEGRNKFSLLLLDVVMPRRGGIETLRELRRFDSNLPVVLLSGCTTSGYMNQARRWDVDAFLTKPVSFDELGCAVREAIAERKARAAAMSSPAVSAGSSGKNRSNHALFGQSWMIHTEPLLRRIAASNVPVLLQGETGVGKEVLARHIHSLSSRADKVFLKVNCAALPSELVESELFGYERGAFTGAHKNYPGKFELANGGTIFLDEIGDMDFKLQAKLLQVLQEGEFLRLGSKEATRVDVRVMAATLRNVEQGIAEKRFREDLYYRLNVVDLHIPPLRSRKEEILPLAAYFLRKHGGNGVIPVISSELEAALLQHSWPGNIRELENYMRKLLILDDQQVIMEELKRRRSAVAATTVVPAAPEATAAPVEVNPVVKTTPASIAVIASPQQAEASGLTSSVPTTAISYPAENSALARVDSARKKAESDAILQALESTHWNRKAAAALLMIDYKALLYKMKKLGIGADKPTFAETFSGATVV